MAVRETNGSETKGSGDRLKFWYERNRADFLIKNLYFEKFFIEI